MTAAVLAALAIAALAALAVALLRSRPERWRAVLALAARLSGGGGGGGGGGRRARRRERLRAAPFPEAWRRILEKNVPYYGRLAPAERAELEKQVQVFVAEKEFEGLGGLELTDEVRVTIAAQACMLTLHLDADYYPRLRSILVYPTTFLPRRATGVPHGTGAERGPVASLGESWTLGAVVLAWDSVLGGAANIHDGHNVVFHEFAHQLDQESGSGDGVPILGTPSSYRTWGRVLREHFEELGDDADRGDETILDPYGTTNPAEFFAVATEAFFERGDAMRVRHPELYDQLRRYYGQDPASSRGDA